MTIIEIYLKAFDNFNIYLKISIQIFLIILFTFFLSKLIKYILFAVFKYFVKSKTNLDNSIIVAVKKPLLFFIWLYCFLVCTDLVIERVDETLLKFSLNLKLIVVYLSVLIFLLRSVTQIKRHYILQREKYGLVLDYTGIDAVEKLSKVVLFIIWSIFVLGKMGFNLNALLAFGGAGGVIVGFAGKDLFANIFGGLIIYLDKPFAVGDWIASPDKEIEGDVEYIGWRQTRILTFEMFPLYVPNSIFGTIVLQNKSRLRSRRLNETLNIRYCDFEKVDKISTEVLIMLKEHIGINKKYKLFSNFVNFTDGMLTFRIYGYTNTTELIRFQEIRQDVLLKATQIIKENGAEIAFKPTHIYMNSKNEIFEKQNIIQDIEK